MTFRYTISPRAKVNAFVPKEMTDLASCRLSMLGAWYLNKLEKLPKSENIDD